MEDALHLEEIFQIIMLKITPNLFWGKIRERLPCRGGGGQASISQIGTEVKDVPEYPEF